MAKPSVLFITKDPRPASIVVTDPGLLRKSEIPIEEIAEVDDEPEPAPLYTVCGDHIELAARNIIDRPVEHSGNFEEKQRWNIALHEAGHAVAAQFVGGCGGVGLQRLSGAWHGVAFDECQEGQSRYNIGLAGCAAECLGPWPGGFLYDSVDFKFARNELRARGVPETEILDRIAFDLNTMAEEFGAKWAKAIRSIALELCKRGWLSGAQVRETMGEAQAMLTKSSTSTTRGKFEDFFPLAKATSAFNQLAGDLKLLEADQLNAEANRPGLTAHDVALLEAQRNRVATRADAIRRGEK